MCRAKSASSSKSDLRSPAGLTVDGEGIAIRLPGGPCVFVIYLLFYLYLFIYLLYYAFTISVIFRVQVPVGFSPQVCTDMKAQFRKPLDDVSLSRSARRTVVVPDVVPKMFWFHNEVLLLGLGNY